jgi:putative ABC transport system permease protein
MSLADADYANILGLKIVKGRWFSRDFPSDATNAMVINESCSRFLGWSDPIGKELENAYMKAKIIGVVKDYNYASLHAAIDPIVFMMPSINGTNGTGRNAIIRFKQGQAKAVQEGVERSWKSFFPNHPFNASFLNDELNQLYRKEEIMLSVLSFFAVLTVFISSLGLFALAAFATEKRTKEIGIRKVMGASVRQIVFLILREFVVLVLLAILLAGPITAYFLNSWLSDFSYRIDLPIWMFFLTGILALSIAIATVALHATRAAHANPIKALRYE